MLKSKIELSCVCDPFEISSKTQNMFELSNFISVKRFVQLK